MAIDKLCLSSSRELSISESSVWLAPSSSIKEVITAKKKKKKKGSRSDDDDEK
jgi:hypothetical protein